MRCKYIRKIFQNEENGYTVALFSTLDHEVPLSARDKFWADKKIIAFTAKGYDLPLTDEIEIEMEGEWETNSHGTQYKVETFLEVVPRTREGILGYLSCGSLKGIGPKTAERIVNRFGLDTLEVMEKYPQELLKIQGISQKKLDRIVDSFGKNKVFRELMTFLSPFHVTPKKANMILQKFRDQSVEIIRKQPYILCSVKGFGFLTVDAIARQCCAATNDPMRISGCVSYVLREAMKQNGHLYLEQEILVKDALKVLNKELNLQPVTETEILKVLYRLVMQDSIVVEENRVYITQQHQEEEDTASMIARKLHERIPVLTIEKELEEAQEDLNITLSEQQKEAVRMVFANPISIITGGPGTGKTTVLKALDFLRKICTEPFDKKTEKFDFEPFLFDEDTPNQNTKFELEFVQNGIRYFYEVELNKNCIVKEKLYNFNPNKALVFERTTDEQKELTSIKFGSKIPKRKTLEDNLEIFTLWNNTVLGGFLKGNIDSYELNVSIYFFTNYLLQTIYLDTNIEEFSAMIIDKNDRNKKIILETLKKADFGIYDIFIKKTKTKASSQIISLIKENKALNDNPIANEILDSGEVDNFQTFFLHKIKDRIIPLSIKKESQGTQKFYDLSGLLSMILNSSKNLPIDEIESSLHPDLFNHFLLTYLVNGKKESQLIATTHNREILSNRDIFRDDAIWFTDKNENSATELYSLADFDSSVVRDTTNVLNAYKSGKLGGVPNLGDYYINLDEE